MSETWTVKVDAPRLSDLKPAIANICRERGYDFEISSDKRWLREIVTFRVKGHDLTAFKWAFRATMDDYASIRILSEE